LSYRTLFHFAFLCSHLRLLALVLAEGAGQGVEELAGW
jgi:hypothetical protein